VGVGVGVKENQSKSWKSYKKSKSQSVKEGV